MADAPGPKAQHRPAFRRPAFYRLAGWGVHLFTASGVVAGLMAINALIDGDFRLSLLWLGAAMVIDGLDGPFARRVDVARHVPRFDGAVLDLVIDYLTYTVIPALLIYRFGLVPPGWELAAAAYVMTTSLYTFGNRDMKTADHYFSGFPATWNLVVLYIFVLAPGSWVSLWVIAGLGLLTFVPLKFIHPFRVTALRPLTIIATVLWATTAVWLVLTNTNPPASANPLITAPQSFWTWALSIWLAASSYFAAISLWRSAQSPAPLSPKDPPS